MKTVKIAIVGTSGSGKSTIAYNLWQFYKNKKVKAVRIPQDDYYIDRSELPAAEIAMLNFDDPAHIDFDLLTSHLATYKHGGEVGVPSFDIKTKKRSVDLKTFEPQQLISVEGISLISSDELASLFDL